MSPVSASPPWRLATRCQIPSAPLRQNLVPASHGPDAGQDSGARAHTSWPANSTGVEAGETGVLVGTEKRRMPVFVPASTVGMTGCYVGGGAAHTA